MAAGEPREIDNPKNILYQDDLVKIVKPGTPGSIPIFTHVGYQGQTKDVVNACEEGLKSYNQVRKENPELGLDPRQNGFFRYEMNANYNDYIFFRAPEKSIKYRSKEDFLQNITFLPFEKLYKLLYDLPRTSSIQYGTKSVVTICIDPLKTYCFHSNSRISSSENNALEGAARAARVKEYREELFGSKKRVIDWIKEPHDVFDENEVVVKLPIIPPDWFATCMAGAPFGEPKYDVNYTDDLDLIARENPGKTAKQIKQIQKQAEKAWDKHAKAMEEFMETAEEYIHPDLIPNHGGRRKLKRKTMKKRGLRKGTRKH